MQISRPRKQKHATYPEVDLRSIAEAIGKDVGYLLPYQKQFEAAAIWYGLNTASPKRIVPSQINQELRKVSAKLDGLYDAIADGLRTLGLKAKLEELEKRQRDLQYTLTEAPPPQPRLHPNLAKLYRERVENLHAALSDPQSRTEAAEILRSLVDGQRILVYWLFSRDQPKLTLSFSVLRHLLSLRDPRAPI